MHTNNWTWHQQHTLELSTGVRIRRRPFWYDVRYAGALQSSTKVRGCVGAFRPGDARHSDPWMSSSEVLSAWILFTTCAKGSKELNLRGTPVTLWCAECHQRYCTVNYAHLKNTSLGHPRAVSDNLWGGANATGYGVRDADTMIQRQRLDPTSRSCGKSICEGYKVIIG